MTNTEGQSQNLDLILASGSPRRRDLLDQMGLCYESAPPDLDESVFNEDDPEALVQTLAAAKARVVHSDYPGATQRWILAADTVVVVDDTILGKPEDASDAERMVRLLSGRTHSVVTGIAVWPPDLPEPTVCVEITRVSFAALTESEISHYLKSGDWRDVAGAYRIQGLAALHIEAISGSYSNVVGLPIHLVYSIFTQHGYRGL